MFIMYMLQGMSGLTLYNTVIIPYGLLKKRKMMLCISIYHCTAADIDYSASVYQVAMEFTDSDNVRSTKCITVRIVDDDLGEADEVFTVRITSPNTRVSIRGGATATIIIVDNEGIVYFLPSNNSL